VLPGCSGCVQDERAGHPVKSGCVQACPCAEGEVQTASYLGTPDRQIAPPASLIPLQTCKTIPYRCSCNNNTHTWPAPHPTRPPGARRLPALRVAHHARPPHPALAPGHDAAARGPAVALCQGKPRRCAPGDARGPGMQGCGCRVCGPYARSLLRWPSGELQSIRQRQQQRQRQRQEH